VLKKESRATPPRQAASKPARGRFHLELEAPLLFASIRFHANAFFLLLLLLLPLFHFVIMFFLRT